MEDLKAVYIEWADAVADPENGWKDEEDTSEFFNRSDNIAREVGFIFSEDKDYICLVSRYMPSSGVALMGSRIKIPKKWIIKRIVY